MTDARSSVTHHLLTSHALQGWSLMIPFICANYFKVFSTPDLIKVHMFVLCSHLGNTGIVFFLIQEICRSSPAPFLKVPCGFFVKKYIYFSWFFLPGQQAMEELHLQQVFFMLYHSPSLLWMDECFSKQAISDFIAICKYCRGQIVKTWTEVLFEGSTKRTLCLVME